MKILRYISLRGKQDISPVCLSPQYVSLFYCDAQFLQRVYSADSMGDNTLMFPSFEHFRCILSYVRSLLTVSRCPCCQQPLAFWPTRWPAHSFTETWTAAEVYDSLMNQWLAHMATHEGSGHVTVNLEWFKLWEPSSRRPDRLTPTQEKRLIDG